MYGIVNQESYGDKMVMKRVGGKVHCILWKITEMKFEEERKKDR